MQGCGARNHIDVSLCLPRRNGLVVNLVRISSAGKKQLDHVQTVHCPIDFGRVWTIAVSRQIPHLGGDIQRAIVHIGPLVQQKCREIVMTVEDRSLHGGETILGLDFIHIGARGNQNLGRLDCTLASRENQRFDARYQRGNRCGARPPRAAARKKRRAHRFSSAVHAAARAEHEERDRARARARGVRADAGARFAPVLRFRRHVFDPAAGALRAAETEQAFGARLRRARRDPHRQHRLSRAPSERHRAAGVRLGVMP